MSPVIVKDNMDIQPLGDIVFYQIEEFAEFNAAMPSVAFAEYFASSCVESRKKGCGTESPLIVCPSFNLPRP